MPVNADQKTLACIALSIKRGKTAKGYSAQASKMAESMSEEKLKEWCEGPVEKE